MGVKGIFKTLVGTVVFIVVAAVITEYINISTNAAITKGMLVKSITKACDYFSQETYKYGAMGNVVGNLPDIEGRGGPIDGIGKFFNGSNVDTVYNELYRNSDDFKRFLNTYPGEWENLDKLYYGLYGTTIVGGRTLDANKKASGERFAESYWSPLNLTIAYLDREVIERMARYNIVQTLSNGNKENIYNDVEGSPYILNNGFKIYYNEVRILGIDYTVYHTNKERERKAFEDATSVDVSSLGLRGDSRTITVATIRYSMPLSYIGISPMKKIMEYLWNNEVKGLNNNSGSLHGGVFNEANVTTMTHETSSGQMPVGGDVLFYILN